MRAYTVATAAFTLKMPTKWVDKVLSHHDLAGITQVRQVIARRLSIDSIVLLAIALKLSKAFYLPLRRSLDLAETVQKHSGRLSVDPHLSLVVDVASIRNETLERLSHAVETVPTPKRGRPRTR